MQEHFTSGAVPFRKAYMRSLIDVIEVDDSQIRIKGSKDVLERAVIASQNREAECSQMSTKWRATVDEDGHYVFAVAHAAADQALQSANLRGLAISHYASLAAAFPISRGDPVTLR